ncbi:MAG TPA: hypothetical protein VLN08_04000, partial [Vicinamibacterales bacterium]|nr:hypothetical protein [Vicinamibacterales bacterium]
IGALKTATLPDRLKAKTDAFTTQRGRLATSLDEVAALLDGKDVSKIKAAIELMHTQYENLERVF